MKMVKFLLMLLMALTLGQPTQAEEPVWMREGPYSFRISEAGAVIIAYLTRDGETPSVIRVPESLGGVPVVGIAYNAFNNSEGAYDGEQVEAILLPDTLRYLEEGAFQCCHDVERIHFPASMDVIPEGSFSHVTADLTVDEGHPFFTVLDGYLIDTRTRTLLYSPWSPWMDEGEDFSGNDAEPVNVNWKDRGSVTLPAVRRIGASALDNLFGYSEIILPHGLESIGSFAIYDKPFLTGMTLPDTVTELDEYAFYATDLKFLRLSEGMTQIPAYCCDSYDLTELTLPSRLTRIGEFAFYMSDIREITLPGTVTFVGFSAFPEDALVRSLNSGTHFETEEEYRARAAGEGRRD